MLLSQEAAPETTEPHSTPKNGVSHYIAKMACLVTRQPFYAAAFLILGFLLIRPIWTVTYLPLGDLPDHAAQIRVVTDYNSYRDLYSVNWFTPYLFGYGSTILLSLFMPVTIALKISLSAALLAVPVASALLIRSIQGNKWWVLTCFPTAYSFSFFWGFLSYIVAIPLVIGFLAFLNVYAKRPLNRRWVIAAAVFSLALFFAHGLAWLLAMAMAFVVLFVHGHFKSLPARMAPFLLIIPVVAFWLARASVNNQSAPLEIGNITQPYLDRFWGELNLCVQDFHGRTTSGGHLNRIKECFSLAIGMPALPDFIFLTGLFLGWPLLLGGRLARDWKRHLPLAAVVLLFILTPYWLFGTAYVYMRIASLLIPASYYSFTFEQKNPLPIGALSWFKRIAPVVVGFILVAWTLSLTLKMFETTRDNDRDFKAVLAVMEPQRRVLQLIFDQESSFKCTPPYMHFGAWYQVEKRGEVFPTFAQATDAANVPVHFRGAIWPLPSSWDPAAFNWSLHEGKRYDYFLVCALSPKDSLFRDAMGSVVLIKQQGAWQLFGRRELKMSPINR